MPTIPFPAYKSLGAPRTLPSKPPHSSWNTGEQRKGVNTSKGCVLVSRRSLRHRTTQPMGRGARGLRLDPRGRRRGSADRYGNGGSPLAPSPFGATCRRRESRARPTGDNPQMISPPRSDRGQLLARGKNVHVLHRTPSDRTNGTAVAVAGHTDVDYSRRRPVTSRRNPWKTPLHLRYSFPLSPHSVRGRAGVDPRREGPSHPSRTAAPSPRKQAPGDSCRGSSGAAAAK